MELCSKMPGVELSTMRCKTLACVLLCLYVLVRAQDSNAVLSADRLATKTVHEMSINQSSVTCPGKPKTVKLHVLNELKPPTFDMKIWLQSTCRKYLLDWMEEAANQNQSFRFTVTYFDRELGYYVNAYNSVFGNYSLDKSYWQILDGSLKPTPVGVSHYIPDNGETVTFNLTVGEH